MEIHVYSILAKKEQKEEKTNPPTQHKQTNMYMYMHTLNLGTTQWVSILPST